MREVRESVSSYDCELRAALARNECAFAVCDFKGYALGRRLPEHVSDYGGIEDDLPRFKNSCTTSRALDGLFEVGSFKCNDVRSFCGDTNTVESFHSSFRGGVFLSDLPGLEER